MTVDLGIVSCWSEERCSCAAIHFDVLRGCERVQASRCIELGIFHCGVPVCLENGSANNTHRLCTGTLQWKRREGVYWHNKVPTGWQWHRRVPGKINSYVKKLDIVRPESYRIAIKPDVV